MSSPVFTLTGTSGDGKVAYIEGPDELSIEVDTDDVNPEEVWPAIEKMVAILNEYWHESTPRRILWP